MTSNFFVCRMNLNKNKMLRWERVIRQKTTESRSMVKCGVNGRMKIILEQSAEERYIVCVSKIGFGNRYKVGRLYERR